jgi:hypothetical protein
MVLVVGYFPRLEPLQIAMVAADELRRASKRELAIEARSPFSFGCGSNPTEPSGSVAAVASKAAGVMAMRIMRLM